MFKKGQLVATRSKRFYVVVEDQRIGGYVRVISPSGNWSVVPERHFTLIGNNYQAKQKCSR